MPGKIIDEFSHLPVSRQRKTQLRYKRDGKCMICGKPLATKYHCLKHAETVRERGRKRLGFQRRFNSLTYRLAAAKKAIRKRAGKSKPEPSSRKL